MRLRAGEIAADQAITITFDGRPIAARRGETVAAALAAAGITVFRMTRAGAPRGLFCGMGVCQDCLVEIDGRPNERACMPKVEGPLAVCSQRFPPTLDDRPDEGIEAAVGPTVLMPDVLVVGAGAGGLTAAAVAAEAGAEVLLVDERPAPGGQYFKQPLAPLAASFDDRQFAAGRRLIERVRAAGVTVVRGTVWGAFVPLEVMVQGSLGGLTVRPRQLIVATGAFERPLPVPGWTLPGVMTTGAAQTLLRSYRVLPGRRIVVVGNGPLNLQGACELHRAGARIVAVAESAPKPGILGLGAMARMALSAPGMVAQGVGYLRELRRAGVPLRHGHVLRSVERQADGLLVRLRTTSDGGGETYAADAVTMGYGFLPANEILRLLGCRHVYDSARGYLVTVRDADGRTSVPAVLGVGDGCGLGGARAAEAEGAIAGLAAAKAVGRSATAAMARARQRALSELARECRFQAALWQLFQAPYPGLTLAAPATMVCRCEEVKLGEIEAALADGAAALGTLKRRTRAGMGRCQGRYCGPLLAQLLQARTGAPLDELAFFAPRPPIRPVPLDAIAAIGEHAPQETETCRST
jgi:NADPH-dependent 2,4-dienoyl-CoA reductase/sulfur reductase-like enzyme